MTKIYNINFLYKLNLIDIIVKSYNISPNTLLMEYDIVFIFGSIYWENLVAIFKSFGINLYGGNSTRRHLLSTVQISLTKFLLLLNNFNQDNILVYNSYNNISKKNKKINYEIELLNLFKMEDNIEKNAIDNNFIYYENPELDLLLWKIRSLQDNSGNYNYIDLLNMKLNLSYQYVSVIFKMIKEIEENKYLIREIISSKQNTEARLEKLKDKGSVIYSNFKLNKKILKAKKDISVYNVNIEDKENNIKNINYRITSYLNKLYYINNNLFNNGIFNLYPSLSVDLKFMKQLIDSDYYKYN